MFTTAVLLHCCCTVNCASFLYTSPTVLLDLTCTSNITLFNVQLALLPLRFASTLPGANLPDWLLLMIIVITDLHQKVFFYFTIIKNVLNIVIFSILLILKEKWNLNSFWIPSVNNTCKKNLSRQLFVVKLSLLITIPLGLPIQRQQNCWCRVVFWLATLKQFC